MSKNGRLFSKNFLTAISQIIPNLISPNYLHFPNPTNFLIQSNKKTDIHYLLRKLLKISDFGFTPKIGFAFFLFFLIFR